MKPILLIPHHMVIIPALPNIFAVLFIAKTLKCRYKLGTRIIRPLYICRDRHPRLSVKYSL